MNTIKINQDQFREMIKNPNDKPVVMLNLLKFKKEGGEKSYARYIKEANRFVEAVGGKLLLFSRPKELLTGTETWDLLMLVKYPSRKAFLAMASNTEYLEIHSFREEALESAVLYATDEISPRDLTQNEINCLEL
ncbi:MAG: DUF1330 domain-containing protein [Smithella sp.]|jgi:uncharacterized protein (DUF1330 family)